MRTEQRRVAGKGSVSSAVPLAVPAVLGALNFGHLSTLQGTSFFSPLCFAVVYGSSWD